MLGYLVDNLQPIPLCRRIHETQHLVYNTNWNYKQRIDSTWNSPPLEITHNRLCVGYTICSALSTALGSEFTTMHVSETAGRSTLAHFLGCLTSLFPFSSAPIRKLRTTETRQPLPN